MHHTGRRTAVSVYRYTCTVLYSIIHCTVQVYIHCTVEYHMLLGAVSKSYQCEESTAHAALTIQQSFQAYENFRRKFPDCEKSFTFKSRCFTYIPCLPPRWKVHQRKQKYFSQCFSWFLGQKYKKIFFHRHSVYSFSEFRKRSRNKKIKFTQYILYMRFVYKSKLTVCKWLVDSV